MAERANLLVVAGLALGAALMFSGRFSGGSSDSGQVTILPVGFGGSGGSGGDGNSESGSTGSGGSSGGLADLGGASFFSDPALDPVQNASAQTTFEAVDQGLIEPVTTGTGEVLDDISGYIGHSGL